ncbi:MAG: ADP-ribosylglycohydrolase family protein, partial [Planctomycetota bacterium]
MKSSITLKEQLPGRFRGSLQGAAIGSALGFPYSGSSRTFMRALGSEVVQGYVRHRSGYFPEGQHGASVQLLTLAADAIADSGAVDASVIVDFWVPLWRENRIIERLTDVDVAMSCWLRRGTSARGCACGPGEQGSGSLLSSILIGLWDHDAPDDLIDDCETLIGLTHEDTTV